MPRPKSTLEFAHIGIGTALKRTDRLEVPLNQREYSWEKKHVLDLFQDFMKAIDDGKSAYFLGTIVLTSGKNAALEVADGQQRLATTTILLAAIRDYFHSQNDDLMVTDLEAFLFTIDRKARDITPRLKLNVDDHEFFRRRVLSKPNSPDRRVKPKFDSHHCIDQAAKMAEQHVRDMLAGYSKKDHSGVLNRWVEFIEDQAHRLQHVGGDLGDLLAHRPPALQAEFRRIGLHLPSAPAHPSDGGRCAIVCECILACLINLLPFFALAQRDTFSTALGFGRRVGSSLSRQSRWIVRPCQSAFGERS
jgi:hypothetical protein